MIQLQGAPLAKFDLSEFTRVMDLSHYDGPLIILFQSKVGENYIFSWADSENEVERWLASQISNDQLKGYLQRESSLREILLNPRPGFLFAMDIKPGWQSDVATVIAPTQLPKDYLPASDSYLTSELSALATPRFSVPIRGAWDISDFYQFPRLLEQAYSFLCHFVSWRPTRELLPAFPMRDGFSSMHFFRELVGEIPAGWELTFRGMRYASPGSIVFEGVPEITQKVFSILVSLKRNGSAARQAYSLLHGVLSEKKLLGQNVQLAQLDPLTERNLESWTTDLLSALEVPNATQLFAMTKNRLGAAKIALAFFRQLDERLLGYERREQIEIPAIFDLPPDQKIRSVATVGEGYEAAAARSAEERLPFDVILNEVGGNRILVIKEIRALFRGLGLAVAKAFLESMPKPLKEGVTKQEAEEIKRKFEAAGAKVEIKNSLRRFSRSPDAS
jgi:large subunit ribosomal protein L7/L12